MNIGKCEKGLLIPWWLDAFDRNEDEEYVYRWDGSDWQETELINQGLAFVDNKISEISCVRCTGPVIEFSVDNDVWNVVVRKGGPEHDKEYLCVWCFLSDMIGYVKTTTA